MGAATRRHVMAAFAIAVAISPIRAQANYQTCADKFVGMDVVRCPDGAVPHYNTGNPPAAPGAATGQQTKPATPASPASEISPLYGVWHTDRPGASYMNALDIPGSYLLAARPGLAQGDLTISPNGTFVWNTFSGTSGRWVRGDKAGIVLYDESSHIRWRVTLVGERILLASESQSFTGRR